MPAQPAGQQPSPLVHVVVTSQLPSTQLPLKHALVPLPQSAWVVQDAQLGSDWHFPSMQLPVKHACSCGLHCTCFTHCWQFGIRTQVPLTQLPLLHASFAGSQSFWVVHDVLPPVELEEVPHPEQVQPG